MQLLSQFRKTPKCNILRATCVAIFVCCKRCRKSNLILLFATIAATTLLTLRSATSSVVATCLAMLLGSLRSEFCELLANQNPCYPLLGPPRSQFCELLATCLAMLCSINQSESLLSSPRSCSGAVLRVAAVPLHSVTPLFGQLQCYALKCCETSCTTKLPSITATLLMQNILCVCSLLLITQHP